MVKLQKSNGNYCHKCVEIMTDEGSFKVYLDPSFNLCFDPVMYNGGFIKEFLKYTITSDNKYVYDLFGDFYDSVVNGGSVSKLEKEESSLVKNKGIEIHSDGFEYNAASVFRIDKDEYNNYVVTLTRSRVVSDDISAFSTRVIQVDFVKGRYAAYSNEITALYYGLEDYDLIHNIVFYNNGISSKRKVRKR